jgi:hypothetical protein
VLENAHQTLEVGLLCRRMSAQISQTFSLKSPESAKTPANLEYLPEKHPADRAGVIETMPIRISRGYVALVSPEDFPTLSLYKWNSLQARNTVYAIRWEYVDGTRKCVYMHRQVMGEPASLVDHRDRDGLHNWRENLREATQVQNHANSGPRKGSASGLKGVFPYGYGGRYRAMIAVNGKIIHLGCRDLPEDAARLYDAAAFHHFGEFAYQNFPNTNQHIY